MKKFVTIVLTFVMLFSILSPTISGAETSEVIVDEGLVLEDTVVEEITETTGIDVSGQDLTTYEEDFDFLVNDPIFMEMEEHFILTDQDVSIEDNSVSGQWIPVAAAAIRLLTSKVGKKGMEKGWALARPYVKKFVDAPSKYDLDGPGSGGRIIQLRKKGSTTLFRLDYAPIKHGRDPVLHYHVPPNLKDHHVIKF
ncbi:hypothetical protein [Cytobacillus firmus]|uniref:hypothetical protein n=1 Tax=Cytobacillus firmus TaxID=1399 RepID=UPI001CFDE0DE|nr:hypothetical protein [Cytobacillus firmus]